MSNHRESKAPCPIVRKTIEYIVNDLFHCQLIEHLVSRRPNYSLYPMIHGEATEFFPRPEPDLILLDVRPSGANGHEILDELRADSRTAKTPIIVLSTDANSAHGDRCLAAGADQFLVKPFDVMRLLGLIDDYLSDFPPLHANALR